MAKRKGEHKSDKEQYAGYKANSRFSKNKRAKLERHLKKFPNDEQAMEALKNVPANPIRKTPNTYVWTGPKIEMARMYARVGINGHVALGGKIAEKHKDQIIGYGVPHVLEQKKLKKKEESAKE